MRRCLMVVMGLLALTGCGGSSPKSSDAPAASSDVQNAPAGADSATAPSALAVLEGERVRLAAALEQGSLDEASMPAYRLRDLTRAFAQQAVGLGAADRRTLTDAAARVNTATLAIESAATSGDLGAARERMAEVQAALGAFHGVAERSQVKGLEAAMESRNVRLHGEIIDPQCYFTHDGRGADHAACALLCARGGQDLAFLDEADGRVYPLIAAAHGMDPNHGLTPHVGRAVDMEGVLFRRGATAFLLIQRVDGQAVVASEGS